MARVVLFHHVRGRTDGVVALADELRSAGHEVVTPDLFDGRCFDTIESGAAFVDELGIPAILDRGRETVGPDVSGIVLMGISLGVLPAQLLAQAGGASGLVALEAFVPPTEFGDGWPDAVPLQVHGMDADPFFAGEGDLDVARAVVDEVGDPGRAELFTYPGAAHLFTDASLDSHEPASATTVVDRVLAFLARIDGAS